MQYQYDMYEINRIHGIVWYGTVERQNDRISNGQWHTSLDNTVATSLEREKAETAATAIPTNLLTRT